MDFVFLLADQADGSGGAVNRQSIVSGLELLVLRLANNQDTETPPSGFERHEWAYVKGIASAAILRTRDALLDAGPSPPREDADVVSPSVKTDRSGLVVNAVREDEQ